MLNKQIIALFLVAIFIRGGLFFHINSYPEVIFQPDSKMYISLAEGLCKYGSFVYPETPARPDVERMPGYPLFLAGVMGLFGGYLPVVLLQIILDAFSCVLIYLLAEKISRGAGLISGLLAAVSVGMITYAHFILNDSLFVFGFLLLLLAVFGFLKRPSWKYCLSIGLGIGILAYVRPVIVYFPLFLTPLFFCFLIFHQKNSIYRAAGKSAAVVALFVIILSPWLARNYSHYGRFRLGAQGGEHLLPYVVPFVWQYSKGIPFLEGMERSEGAFLEKVRRENLDLRTLNPFEKGDIQERMAVEYLMREPKLAILKAWGFGMAKNLFAPAVIDLSYLLNLDRPHFFSTKGRTFVERAKNFIHEMEGIFGWIVIGSVAGLAMARVLQSLGFFILARHEFWNAAFLFCITLYFLLISGPVGYAKYRLPFEPLLIVLAAIGIRGLFSVLSKNKAGKSSEETVKKEGTTE